MCVCVPQSAPGAGQPWCLELSSQFGSLYIPVSLHARFSGTTSPGIFFSPPTTRSRPGLRPQPCRGIAVSNQRGLGHEDLQTPSIQEQQMELLQGAYRCLNPPIPRGDTGTDKRQFPTHSAVYVVISFYANSQGEVAEL